MGICEPPRVGRGVSIRVVDHQGLDPQRHALFQHSYKKTLSTYIIDRPDVASVPHSQFHRDTCLENCQPRGAPRVLFLPCSRVPDPFRASFEFRDLLSSYMT